MDLHKAHLHNALHKLHKPEGCWLAGGGGEAGGKMPRQPSQRGWGKAPPSPSGPMARAISSVTRLQQPTLCLPALSFRAHRTPNDFWSQGLCGWKLGGSLLPPPP